MKIDDRLLNYEIDKYIASPQGKPAEGIDATPSSSVEKAEKAETEGPHQDAIVHLSQRSREAQQIRDIISSEPAVREEKVLALRDEIKSGRYRIDYEAVADRIVDSFIEEIS